MARSINQVILLIFEQESLFYSIFIISVKSFFRIFPNKTVGFRIRFYLISVGHLLDTNNNSH